VLRRLIRKELRELAASRAYWLMLIVVAALVGHAFITATDLYAEASGAAGGPAALSQGLSPLEGIVVPTFGAYDLAATLLFPFVVIRLVADEKQTGALALLLQAPGSFAIAIAAKGIALIVGWVVAFLPGISALVYWRMIGGHLYAPEVANVLLGHVLRGLLTIGLGAAAGALAASSASAAILVLTATLGTWAIDLVGAARGGMLQVLSTYTPTAALRVFEHGELRLNTVVVLTVLFVAGLAVATEWLREGRRVTRRIARIGAMLAIAALVIAGGMRLRISRDVSEDRRNSFPRADEAALASINTPLDITVYLAAEDPRLTDLERGVLAKLRRTMHDVRVTYATSGRTGLFEKPDSHYGEVWYALGDKRAMTRSTTEPIVLETIYQLAGRPAPLTAAEAVYPGYPSTARPRGAPIVFFVVWPLLIAGAWWRVRGPSSII
jgi:ABC-2 type transport system permease protein